MKYISILFFALSSLASDRIIGGTVSDPAHWPEVVKLEQSGCTATVVGPRSVLTAAHCTKKKSQTFKAAGKSYSVEFSAAKGPDLAMGSTGQDIAVKPAKISPKVVVGQKLKLVGYGANKPGFLGIGGGSGAGVLREGDAEVRGLSNLYAEIRGKAAIYYGDSGGPAYDLESLEAGSHQVVAVHSRTNSGKITYDARMDTEDAQRFLNLWMVEHDAAVCGLNSECDSKP